MSNNTSFDNFNPPASRADRAARIATNFILTLKNFVAIHGDRWRAHVPDLRDAVEDDVRDELEDFRNEIANDRKLD